MWEQLQRLAAATQRWRELVETLEASIPNLPPKDRGDAWMQIGRIYELWLHDLERARACYDRIGQKTELLRVAEERLRAARPSEQAALKRELAATLAAAGDQEAAIYRYEELRAESPADVTVLRALAKLYEQAGATRDQLRTLSALAGVIDDCAERAALYRQMATLHERLGAKAQAEECLECVLSFDARDERAYVALEELYLHDRRWRAAIDVFCRHAAVVSPEAA